MANIRNVNIDHSFFASRNKPAVKGKIGVAETLSKHNLTDSTEKEIDLTENGKIQIRKNLGDAVAKFNQATAVISPERHARMDYVEKKLSSSQMLTHEELTELSKKIDDITAIEGSNPDAETKVSVADMIKTHSILASHNMQMKFIELICTGKIVPKYGDIGERQDTIENGTPQKIFDATMFFINLFPKSIQQLIQASLYNRNQTIDSIITFFNSLKVTTTGEHTLKSFVTSPISKDAFSKYFKERGYSSSLIDKMYKYVPEKSILKSDQLELINKLSNLRGSIVKKIINSNNEFLENAGRSIDNLKDTMKKYENLLTLAKQSLNSIKINAAFDRKALLELLPKIVTSTNAASDPITESHHYKELLYVLNNYFKDNDAQKETLIRGFETIISECNQQLTDLKGVINGFEKEKSSKLNDLYKVVDSVSISNLNNQQKFGENLSEQLDAFIDGNFGGSASTKIFNSIVRVAKHVMAGALGVATGFFTGWMTRLFLGSGKINTIISAGAGIVAGITTTAAAEAVLRNPEHHDGVNVTNTDNESNLFDQYIKAVDSCVELTRNMMKQVNFHQMNVDAIDYQYKNLALNFPKEYSILKNRFIDYLNIRDADKLKDFCSEKLCAEIVEKFYPNGIDESLSTVLNNCVSLIISKYIESNSWSSLKERLAGNDVLFLLLSIIQDSMNGIVTNSSNVSGDAALNHRLRVLAFYMHNTLASDLVNENNITTLSLLSKDVNISAEMSDYLNTVSALHTFGNSSNCAVVNSLNNEIGAIQTEACKIKDRVASSNGGYYHNLKLLIGGNSDSVPVTQVELTTAVKKLDLCKNKISSYEEIRKAQTEFEKIQSDYSEKLTEYQKLHQIYKQYTRHSTVVNLRSDVHLEDYNGGDGVIGLKIRALENNDLVNNKDILASISTSTAQINAEHEKIAKKTESLRNLIIDIQNKLQQEIKTTVNKLADLSSEDTKLKTDLEKLVASIDSIVSKLLSNGGGISWESLLISRLERLDKKFDIDGVTRQLEKLGDLINEEQRNSLITSLNTFNDYIDYKTNKITSLQSITSQFNEGKLHLNQLEELSQSIAKSLSNSNNVVDFNERSSDKPQLINNIDVALLINKADDNINIILDMNSAVCEAEAKQYIHSFVTSGYTPVRTLAKITNGNEETTQTNGSKINPSLIGAAKTLTSIDLNNEFNIFNIDQSNVEVERLSTNIDGAIILMNNLLNYLQQDQNNTIAISLACLSLIMKSLRMISAPNSDLRSIIKDVINSYKEYLVNPESQVLFLDNINKLDNAINIEFSHLSNFQVIGEIRAVIRKIEVIAKEKACVTNVSDMNNEQKHKFRISQAQLNAELATVRTAGFSNNIHLILLLSKFNQYFESFDIMHLHPRKSFGVHVDSKSESAQEVGSLLEYEYGVFCEKVKAYLKKTNNFTDDNWGQTEASFRQNLIEFLGALGDYTSTTYKMGTIVKAYVEGSKLQLDTSKDVSTHGLRNYHSYWDAHTETPLYEIIQPSDNTVRYHENDHQFNEVFKQNIITPIVDCIRKNPVKTLSLDYDDFKEQCNKIRDFNQIYVFMKKYLGDKHIIFPDQDVNLETINETDSLRMAYMFMALYYVYFRDIEADTYILDTHQLLTKIGVNKYLASSINKGSEVKVVFMPEISIPAYVSAAFSLVNNQSYTNLNSVLAELFYSKEDNEPSKNCVYSFSHLENYLDEISYTNLGNTLDVALAQVAKDSEGRREQFLNAMRYHLILNMINNVKNKEVSHSRRNSIKI